MAVPLHELLSTDICGHPKNSKFPCKEGCSLAEFAKANMPSWLLKEGRSVVKDMKITGFMLCRFFSRLNEQQREGLKQFEDTHSAICGIEVPNDLAIKKGYMHTDLCFTGFGHGYYKDEKGKRIKLRLTQFELACMETWEEAGMDIKEELESQKLEVYNWKNSEEVHEGWGTGDPIEIDQGNEERGLKRKRYTRRIWVLLDKHQQ